MDDVAIETVPGFDTTIYRYCRQDGERVPKGATHITIDPSVKRIKQYIFKGCVNKLKWCKIHGGVEKIERHVFEKCTPLEALFLPSMPRKLKNVHSRNA